MLVCRKYAEGIRMLKELAALRDYARALRRTLTDSAAENENLRVIFREVD